MVRLVFRPYTQIWRSICTSESLRASTRVSSGFTLFRHSSPSFGSQQLCSYSNPSIDKLPGRSMVHATRAFPPAFTFISRMGFHHPNTRIDARLLGPCFKTGHWKPLCQHPWHEAAVLSPQWTYYNKGYKHSPGRTRKATFPYSFSAPENWCWPTTGSECIVSRRDYWSHPGKTDFQCFPFSNFTYYLTLFSKFFSSFDHSTCSLSVSRQYLALDEIYHPFRAAFPNNSTLRKRFIWHIQSTKDGVLTLSDVLFQGT